MFTAERILALCHGADQAIAGIAAASLEAQCGEFGVDRFLRRAYFMGQVAHESAGFTRLEENLHYSAARIKAVWPRLAPRADALAQNPEALANAAYGGRLGNDDAATGDGWRYRGRGFIMLTGRDNYSFFGAAAGHDLLKNPEDAATPAIAARLALAFWRARNCNPVADLDDIEAVTRRINGVALEGIDLRRALTAKAKTIFLDDEPLVA